LAIKPFLVSGRVLTLGGIVFLTCVKQLSKNILMKKYIIVYLFLLLAGSAYAQQGRNTPRSGRKDQPQQTAPVQNQNAKQQSQMKSSQNATGQSNNRNDDRIIGNKEDNLMEMDTSRGKGADTPHGKTPDAIKEKATPEPASNRTNTPNSMVPEPDNSNVSSDYNPTSNGGIGRDTMQIQDTKNYMNDLNKKIPSAKKPANRQSGNSTVGTTTGPANAGKGGLSPSVNETGKTKIGTTGTGYSTGSNAGENAGNTSAGNNASNRTSTTTQKPAAKPKKDQ